MQSATSSMHLDQTVTITNTGAGVEHHATRLERKAVCETLKCNSESSREFARSVVEFLVCTHDDQSGLLTADSKRINSETYYTVRIAESLENKGFEETKHDFQAMDI